MTIEEILEELAKLGIQLNQPLGDDPTVADLLGELFLRDLVIVDILRFTDAGHQMTPGEFRRRLDECAHNARNRLAIAEPLQDWINNRPTATI